MPRLRPIRHEDQLSVIDHLDELRSRIIICGVALAIAFVVCFWQNGPLITVLNRALPEQPDSGLAAAQRTNAELGKYLRNEHTSLNKVAAEINTLGGQIASIKGAPSSVTATTGAISSQLQGMATSAGHTAKNLPTKIDTQEKPITIGPAESFTTTLMVAAYFALLFTLPLLLYQVYAFVIPALSREERKIAVPTVIAAPILFAAGAVFTYFLILPPAIHFLQGYNAQHFQILIQAKTYYKFEIVLMIAIGIAFQVPLLLLGLQKAGLVTARTLTANWRYAVVLIAVAVAALPGVDPVTMFFEALPLLVLYGASVVLLTVIDRRTAKREAREAADAALAAAAEAETREHEPV